MGFYGLLWGRGEVLRFLWRFSGIGSFLWCIMEAFWDLTRVLWGPMGILWGQEVLMGFYGVRGDL